MVRLVKLSGENVVLELPQMQMRFFCPSEFARHLSQDLLIGFYPGFLLKTDKCLYIFYKWTKDNIMARLSAVRSLTGP